MNELKYTRTHEWVRCQDKEAEIGITEHAQKLLGDMVYIDMPKVGAIVRAGESLGVVESVKAASDFYAPISGEVIAINQKAVEDPALVNQDPYGQGWLVKLKVSQIDELQKLLTESAYFQEISEDA